MLSNVANYLFGFGAIALFTVVGITFTLFAMQPPSHFLLWFAIPIDIVYAGVILIVLKLTFGKRV